MRSDMDEPSTLQSSGAILLGDPRIVDEADSFQRLSDAEHLRTIDTVLVSFVLILDEVERLDCRRCRHWPYSPLRVFRPIAAPMDSVFKSPVR